MFLNTPQATHKVLLPMLALMLMSRSALGQSVPQSTITIIEPSPYVLVSLPNPKGSWGVMGIVPQFTSGRKMSYFVRTAEFAYRQFREVKGKIGWQIVVFTDRQAAMLFRDYQIKRRSAAILPADCVHLASIWSKVPVFYIYRNSKVKILYPSQNPTAWWK